MGCKDWELYKNDATESSYRTALGAYCDKKEPITIEDPGSEVPKIYTRELKWGHFTDTQISDTGSYDSYLCPPYMNLAVQHNLTSKPFKQTTSILSPGAAVYRLEHLYPINGKSVTMGAIFDALKKCYWVDLLTEEIVISVPFVSVGDGTFGEIRYTL